MKANKEFLIPFVGLKLGKHHFEFKINKTFLDIFDYQEFEDCDVAIEVVLEKKSTMLEVAFKHNGTVYVPCDLTNEMFHLPIKGQSRLVVKFGEEYNNDNDELLILPHGEYQIDVSQYIFENVVLSVPQKRIHPGVKDGTLQTEALEQLSKLSIKKINKNKQEDIDPRWDKLKQLLTDKNK